MLTKVKAYSSWQAAEALLLDDAGQAETDPLQILNVEGLGPVEAAVNSVPLATFDGESYSGSSVGRRNIVMTVRPNPDWNVWTYERLRRLVYSYFMPRGLTRLIFETDEIDPVEIYGYVESVEPAIFSKNGEIVVSVICPQPHFTSVDPTIVNGTNGVETVIDYDGSISTPFNLKVLHTDGVSPTYVRAQFGGLVPRNQQVQTYLSATEYFLSNSVPGNKYVRRVDSDSGVYTNLLQHIVSGSSWLTLELGENEFTVVTDSGDQDWTMTYYKKYGGL